MKNLKLLTFLLIILFNRFLSAEIKNNIDIKGQLSSYYVYENNIKDSFGFRYIPTFSFKIFSAKNRTLDFESAFNFNTSAHTDDPHTIFNNFNGKYYRLWGRLYSPHCEIRLGLQKINFGQAVLLRPLKWFDKIDPRDPLQFTEGVKALLFRYYFNNNVNIWIWGLSENDNTKGWEILPTAGNNPEWGGRLQIPVFNGELAGTFHRRTALLVIPTPLLPTPLRYTVPESRYAFDGKWDIIVGVWFETSLTHQSLKILPYSDKTMSTLGTDYTFNIGSGLHVTAEHLRATLGNSPYEAIEKYDITALSSDYFIGMFDRLSAMVFYDHNGDDFFFHAGWGKIYDNWSFFLNVFKNPDSEGNSLIGESFKGSGFQLIAVFNH